MSTTVTQRITGLVGRSGIVANDAVLRPPAPRVGSAVAARLRGGDQLALFVLAALGMVILSPRIVFRAYAVIIEALTGSPGDVNWNSWPRVPVMLPVGVAVGLITFRLEQAARLSLMAGTLVALAVITGPLNTETALPLTLFALTTYALIRLPWPRFVVALLVSAFTILSVVAAQRWFSDTLVPAIIGGFAIVVPLLWNSVYEHRRDSPLKLRRFILFVGGRLLNSPVMTYRDLFSTAEGDQLTATRWAGVRALYIALLASIAAQLIKTISTMSPIANMSGAPLLVMSYLDYVVYCCSFVVRFNVFIGVLRLAGIPIRSNFRYWLLARTPNEHWQRWNLLSREWFLTFVFYPIMRARRWLFVAIMSALLVTGVLHVLPRVLLGGIGMPEFTARSVYWLINGVVIYLVIKIPAKYPGLVERLGIPGSRTWSVVGIVLTSAFYGFLHGLRMSSQSWAEMGQYLAHLARIIPL